MRPAARLLALPLFFSLVVCGACAGLGNGADGGGLLFFPRGDTPSSFFLLPLDERGLNSKHFQIRRWSVRLSMRRLATPPPSKDCVVLHCGCQARTLAPLARNAGRTVASPVWSTPIERCSCAPCRQQSQFFCGLWFARHQHRLGPNHALLDECTLATLICWDLYLLSETQRLPVSARGTRHLRLGPRATGKSWQVGPSRRVSRHEKRTCQDLVKAPMAQVDGRWQTLGWTSGICLLLQDGRLYFFHVYEVATNLDACTVMKQPLSRMPRACRSRSLMHTFGRHHSTSRGWSRQEALRASEPQQLSDFPGVGRSSLGNAEPNSSVPSPMWHRPTQWRRVRSLPSSATRHDLPRQGVNASRNVS